MSKAGKITAAISGAFLLLIVVAIILIATFDWNRLKPTINQKVSAELNRPFAIRGDLGVVWERQKQETGWRSWVPWPHVHAEDIILGNPPDIPEVTMVHLPRVEATLAPLALRSGAAVAGHGIIDPVCPPFSKIPPGPNACSPWCRVLTAGLLSRFFCSPAPDCWRCTRRASITVRDENGSAIFAICISVARVRLARGR